MVNERQENIELADSTRGTIPAADRRRRIPEPLPVRLVAVEDVNSEAPAELSRELDEFYVTLLGFEREHIQRKNIYRAENLRLHITLIQEQPERDLRPLGIEVVSLAEVQHGLIEREMEFEVKKGLLPGQPTLLLLDPAGNWVAISEASAVR
jgi:hypothetical protein